MRKAAAAHGLMGAVCEFGNLARHSWGTKLKFLGHSWGKKLPGAQLGYNLKTVYRRAL